MSSCPVESLTNDNQCGSAIPPIMGPDYIDEVVCAPVRYGRYVYITQSGVTDELALCEVTIYGKEGECRTVNMGKVGHLNLNHIQARSQTRF